jgi:drug/metabolite transporter (DMT)-like permease
MLLATVLLWALNLSASKVILEHGLHPLSFSIVRFGLAGLVFIGLALAAERTLRIERRHVGVLVLAALTLWVNQLCFVLALDAASASTIGLIFGALPIFAALLGIALGRERLTARFWVAAAISFAGVGFVALGSTTDVSGSYEGILLGLVTAATWAGYSVAVAPLMAVYSPSRVSAVVVPLAWALIILVGAPSASDQEWSLGWEIWALVVLTALGPLVLTNVLWFRLLYRIGPARATLAANLQPFVAALLAVILLSEPLGLLQVAGGVLIALGILVARGSGFRPRSG